MKRVGFRARLLFILFLLAVVPLVVLTLVFSGTVRFGLPFLMGSESAWETVAATGRPALEIARRGAATPAERAIVDAHERQLEETLLRTGQLSALTKRIPILAVGLVVLTLSVLIIAVARIAGHLSRQLSRPLQELVGWTELIARGEPLPEGPPRRGAPEFEMLRIRMRRMARDLSQARDRELDAERLRAFRESARQVAHELKNPLTPIRFALERLKRDVPAELTDTVAVLATETERLEQMARDFAQFGRLPEGPTADVDIGELVRYAATATIPPHLRVVLELPDALPMVRGHYDPLARALTNVLLNAVAACGDRGTITLAVSETRLRDLPAVRMTVRDTGCGIPAAQLDSIWEPYVTYKAGGTGLGLAIARQTILAHGGEVHAESTTGAGTAIHFTLPVAEHARPGGATTERPARREAVLDGRSA